MSEYGRVYMDSLLAPPQPMKILGAPQIVGIRITLILHRNMYACRDISDNTAVSDEDTSGVTKLLVLNVIKPLF